MIQLHDLRANECKRLRKRAKSFKPNHELFYHSAAALQFVIIDSVCVLLIDAMWYFIGETLNTADLLKSRSTRSLNWIDKF